MEPTCVHGVPALSQRCHQCDERVKLSDQKRIAELEAEVQRLRRALQRQIDGCDGDCVLCDEARTALMPEEKG